MRIKPRRPVHVLHGSATTASNAGVLSVWLLLCLTGLAYSASNDNNVEWNGVFADQSALYMAPVEPSSSDPVLLTLRVFKQDINSANIKYYDTADSGMHWISMAWNRNDVTGTFDFWQGTVPASASIKYYRFQINDGSSTAWLNARGINSAEQGSGDFWIVPGFHTPAWSKNAIYYQIFPDRFYDGNSGNNITFLSSSPVSPPCPAGSYLYGGQCAYQHNSWSELPQNPTVGADFFGGDLAGITGKIDPYLKGNLGITALYLNPIFKSGSNHKYDTQDYLQVDPHFGTNADLQTLVGAAHNNSGAGNYRMSVILDGVFNHVSDSHQWFDSQNLFVTDGAYESQTSQWYNRFTFLTWPSVYCNWGGFNSLAKLNYGSSLLRDEIYRGASSVMQTYLKPPYSVDGWRYDVGADIVTITSTPGAGSCSGTDDHAIWQEIRPYLKGINNEALLLVEEWGNASLWMHGDEWDSVMNYNGFNVPVSKWITCQNVHGEEAGVCLSVSDFDNWLSGTRGDYPRPTLLSMMNSLTTHDTSRFLYRAGGDVWKLYLAFIFQMTYVGAPSIYYGDEVGLTGANDPDNRRTFDWNTLNWNQSVLDLTKTLIQARKDVSAFTRGSFKTLLVDNANKVYGFGRWDDVSWAIVVLNNDSTGHAATADAYQLSIPNGTVMTDRLTGSNYTVVNGQISIPSSALLGHYGVVLTASNPQNPSGDADADGVYNSVDCKPLDNSVWAIPSEARDLNLAGSGTTMLSWTAPSSTGGSSVRYDVIRSTYPSSFQSGTCLVSDTSATSTTDSSIPAGSYSYLVRSRNACGGNLGTDSGGNPRTAAVCP